MPGSAAPAACPRLRSVGRSARHEIAGGHGLLVIALTDDRGRLLWVSAARPGRTSEITACGHDQLTAKLRAAGLGAIGDLGFGGLDDSGPDADPAVITGYKAARNRPLTSSTHDQHEHPEPRTHQTRDQQLHDAQGSMGVDLR
ncbi:hypothetical protein AB5J56_05125 [Streptomyces sp. R21]|uniref:Transposase n=1 Tax=Streptomyces sp. R21 TaxID=3238627 RepID=A0AB39NZP7_9ACTN